MTELESWGKEMGWCQTNKLNFWKNGSYNEFMGVSDGYVCMVMDWRGRIYLRVFFFAENKERAKEVQTMVRRQRDLLPKCGITTRDNLVMLSFGSFLWLFRNKVERAKAALPVMTSWLRSNGVKPNGVCECGRQDGLKCVLEGDGAVHMRCPDCAARVLSSAPSIPS
jgi:hypothetical protein